MDSLRAAVPFTARVYPRWCAVVPWPPTIDNRTMYGPEQFVNGLHVRRLGDRGPAVVFESGLGASCLGWTAVQAALDGSAQTLSYDRPGHGWSPSLRGEPSLREITDDLRALVSAAELNTPFVLVGHSLGALIARVYAARFSSDLAGLVLVDPELPDQWQQPDGASRRRLRRALFYTRAAEAAAASGLARLGLWGLLRRGHGNPGPLLGLSQTMRRVAMEVAKLSPEAARAVQEFWSRPQFYQTLAKYIRALPSLAREAVSSPWPAGVPIAVLSGSHQPAATLAQHRAMATRHVIVDGSAHWIHLDRPELIVQAILEVGR